MSLAELEAQYESLIVQAQKAEKDLDDLKKSMGSSPSMSEVKLEEALNEARKDTQMELNNVERQIMDLKAKEGKNDE
ncbi:unnamed protein product [Clonostachys rosea]|uniref:Uncharacterized protein n=1 Tax=Bionectria ochroleuca TaxID=29856 RepID=A0ABY6URZ4_BIOOC|nr:unnamed protein product [Clonostachys rosea]